MLEAALLLFAAALFVASLALHRWTNRKIAAKHCAQRRGHVLIHPTLKVSDRPIPTPPMSSQHRHRA